MGPPPTMTTFLFVDGLASHSVLVCRVEVRRLGLELGGARVDHLEDRPACPVARLIDLMRLLVLACDEGDVLVAEPEPFAAQRLEVQLLLERRSPSRLSFGPSPRRTGPTRRARRSASSTSPRLMRLGDRVEPHVRRLLSSFSSSARLHSSGSSPMPVDLEGPHRLQQRLLDVPADRHDLARALHLGAEPPVDGPELVERPARDLHDDIVDRRLERRAGLPGDRVRVSRPASSRPRSSRPPSRSDSPSPSMRGRCSSRPSG